MGAMSSPRSLYLLGALLLPLLLLPGSWAQHYDDFTSSPDYDSDYNSTFEYSFFSNTSSEDLDRLVERYLDPDETTEDTGGPEEEVAVTMVITRRTTEGVNAHSTAPFPVCLETRTLLWTLMILLVLQQPQHILMNGWNIQAVTVPVVAAVIQCIATWWRLLCHGCW